MIDLDRFKQVNDTQGHVAGDKLLVETGKRISSCLRSMDTVARLGGDEFAVIIEEYGRKSEVIRIVRRLLEEIESPALIGGSSVQVTASAGVVMDMDRYRTPEEILRDADISMYKAKEQGKNRFRVFTPSMHTEAVEAVALENDLKRAIREKELFLEFQPIQSLKDSRTVGFEALVRWRHPAKGLLGPDQFIPLAEESGQILEIGAWVLRKACSTMAGWRESIQATREMVIAVNLSGRQLEQADLVESIGDILRETGLPAEALRLEITETSLTVNSDRVLKIFNEIKNLGVQISIDDFGTGYSSLSYLQNFPVDTLKVDRSFIQGIANGHEDLEIVRAVVFLAHSLGMDVVAEGVEEIEQLTAVQGLDCEYVQGFYFSHPVSQAEIEKMLASMADTGSC
jgi:diguanylate cyclase (GGDEF)-like protein